MTKINEPELLSRLTDVFRAYGYDRASLSKISEVTGLGRSSLYHRFPGGKAEMAEAVLTAADEWLGKYVLGPLGEPGEPAARLEHMAKKVHEFYLGGQRSCLLDALSFAGEEGAIMEHVRASTKAWIGAINAVLKDAGLPARTARERAEDALVRIQGSLVLARATGNRSAFRRTLTALPGDLLRHEEGTPA